MVDLQIKNASGISSGMFFLRAHRLSKSLDEPLIVIDLSSVDSHSDARAYQTWSARIDDIRELYAIKNKDVHHREINELTEHRYYGFVSRTQSC